MGNFVCDVAKQKFGADACLINSGTFRSDQIHPAGDFKLRDLTALFPFSDGTVQLRLSAQAQSLCYGCDVALAHA